MGYFSNGAEGDIYEEQYCLRCFHEKSGCAVWLAHILYNYDAANNDKSILDLLIPRETINDVPSNGKCKMFVGLNSPDLQIREMP